MSFPPCELRVFPFVPKFVYYNMACFKCFKLSEPSARVQPCTRCRRVSYCNVECQRDDFVDHKRFCVAISSVDKSSRCLAVWRGPYVFGGLADLSFEQCSKVCAAAEEILGRRLSVKERHMVVYEPRCGVCFRTERDLRGATDVEAYRQGLHYTRKLKHCRDCAHMFCCSDAHGLMLRDDHENTNNPKTAPDSPCSRLRKAMTDDSVAIKCDIEVEGPFAWIPARRKLRITPLLSEPTQAGLTNWDQWFCDPSTMFPFKDFELESSTVRMLSKGLTFPLTILHAIHIFDSMPITERAPLSAPGPSLLSLPVLLTQRPSLEIHVIGATEQDLFGGCGYVYEEVLHSLPACTQLTIRFIGPALCEATIFDRRQEEETTIDNCDDCNARGLTRIQSLHPQLYHDWLPFTRKAIRAQDLRPALPDLAVIFNGSFVQEEDREKWVPTLLMLAGHGVPTIVTDVNELYGGVSQVMARVCGAKILAPLQKNPWRNECGTPEPYGGPDFLYQNDVFFCFRGSER